MIKPFLVWLRATSQSPLHRRQRIAFARSILLIRGIRGRRRDHIFGGVSAKGRTAATEFLRSLIDKAGRAKAA